MRFLLGAERVIAIDEVPERLQMAEEGGAETINYEEQNVYEALMDMTGGRGPDACIDDVGMEAHAPGLIFAYDRVKQAMMLETDRPHALREAIMCCRNGGIDFGDRRLWRIHRQVSDRLGDESFADDQDGTGARADVTCGRCWR